MFVVVTGGSGSGKSEFSEDLLLKLDEKKHLSGKISRFYIATMFPFDEESHMRIARHRKMRKDKGFSTIECYTGLKNLKLPSEGEEKPSVLLECMSNLTANEIYREDGAGKKAPEEIIKGIRSLLEQTENLVVVTNEVFSDGIQYDESTEGYRNALGTINREMAALSDAFVEVVYSIPIYHKGEPLC